MLYQLIPGQPNYSCAVAGTSGGDVVVKLLRRQEEVAHQWGQHGVGVFLADQFCVVSHLLLYSTWHFRRMWLVFFKSICEQCPCGPPSGTQPEQFSAYRFLISSFIFDQSTARQSHLKRINRCTYGGYFCAPKGLALTKATSTSWRIGEKFESACTPKASIELGLQRLRELF